MPDVRETFCFILFYFYFFFADSFEGRMWDLIVSVPDHCLSFYFTGSKDTEPYKKNVSFLCQYILLNTGAGWF